MPEIILSKVMSNTLQEVGSSNSHAILIQGPAGAGKYMLAEELARLRLKVSQDMPLNQHPYVSIVDPATATISIDEIRNLQRFLQLKAPGRERWRRATIINDAQRMTVEAQNALLKTLEEPPLDTFVILTATNGQHLKPTILSRMTILPVTSLSADEAVQYFESLGYSRDVIARAYAMSGGYVGLMSSLLKKDTDYGLVASITLAKELVGLDPFERLLHVETLSKQAETLPLLLQSLRLVCEAALKSTAQTGGQRRLSRVLDVVYKAERTLHIHPNTKLLLTNLMLNL